MSTDTTNNTKYASVKNDQTHYEVHSEAKITTTLRLLNTWNVKDKVTAMVFCLVIIEIIISHAEVSSSLSRLSLRYSSHNYVSNHPEKIKND